MSDYFEEMAELAMGDESYESHCPKLRRQIINVLKQVERDARHSAMDLTYECANKIQNLRLNF